MKELDQKNQGKNLILPLILSGFSYPVVLINDHWSVFICFLLYLNAGISPDVKGEIDKLTQQYVKEVANLKSDERQQRLEDINCTYKKSHMICDNKVQLATQTYEMVIHNMCFFWCAGILTHHTIEWWL